MAESDNLSWREMITWEMDRNSDSWDDVVSNTMTDEEMDVVFYSGFGGAEGVPFTIWTKRRVYFPTEYDGAEGVASVSRNPDGKRTEHV